MKSDHFRRMTEIIEGLDASDTPLATLSKGRFGPEPIGYEPIKHPIRRKLWMLLADRLCCIRVFSRIQAQIDDWSYAASRRSHKHDAEPIYEEGAWEPYRTIKWGPDSYTEGFENYPKD